MAENDERLRALLEDAVSDVEPRPGLDPIQSRTKVTPMSSRRPWRYAAAGAVAATAATVAAVMVLADRDDAPAPGPAASSPHATPSAGPSHRSGTPDASPTTGPAASPSGTGTASTLTLPVYYVADSPTGPRLFREFHRVTTDSALEAALRQALGSTALDPDYGSPWAGSGATVATAQMRGDVLTVDLDGPAALRDRPAGMSRQQAEAAVQQLVYTAHAVLQDRPPVQLLLDGQRTDRLLGVPVAEPLAAADPMQVQGTVWVIDPQDGDTVRPTFTVTGRGAFFEANVSWQLVQDGRPVRQGHATAQECCTLSPYSFTVRDAAPGHYTLRVYDADMSDGEGNGEAEDTKRITVAD